MYFLIFIPTEHVILKLENLNQQLKDVAAIRKRNS